MVSPGSRVRVAVGYCAVSIRHGAAVVLWSDSGIRLQGRENWERPWLGKQGATPEAEGLAEEARAVFEHIEATPWIERASRLATVVPA